MYNLIFRHFSPGAGGQAGESNGGGGGGVFVDGMGPRDGGFNHGEGFGGGGGGATGLPGSPGVIILEFI